MMSTKQENRGFALLFSLVVSSVVLAIGLTILDFTIKQLTLSSVTRDSELAFHAANAGIECVRAAAKTAASGGAAIDQNMSCIGNSPDSDAPVTINNVTYYHMEYDWLSPDSAGDRCIELDVLVVDATSVAVSSADIRNDMPSALRYFPASATADCGGGICYIVGSQGLNRSCGTGSTGTVVREIVKRF